MFEVCWIRNGEKYPPLMFFQWISFCFNCFLHLSFWKQSLIVNLISSSGKLPIVFMQEWAQFPMNQTFSSVGDLSQLHTILCLIETLFFCNIYLCYEISDSCFKVYCTVFLKHISGGPFKILSYCRTLNDQ